MTGILKVDFIADAKIVQQRHRFSKQPVTA